MRSNVQSTRTGPTMRRVVSVMLVWLLAGCMSTVTKDMTLTHGHDTYGSIHARTGWGGDLRWPPDEGLDRFEVRLDRKLVERRGFTLTDDGLQLACLVTKFAHGVILVPFSPVSMLSGSGHGYPSEAEVRFEVRNADGHVLATGYVGVESGGHSDEAARGALERCADEIAAMTRREFLKK